MLLQQGSTSTLDGAGGGGDINNATRESLTSLVDNGNYTAFARDQPGRQSMSEKRHATLDAKSTDTYQKRKKVSMSKNSRDFDRSETAETR